MKHLISYKTYFLILIIIALLISCTSKSNDKKQPQRSAPVNVAKVIKKDIPIVINAIGNIEASATISLKSQVNGQVSEIYFKEGSYIKKGDLLITIDSRPFEYAVRLAEASLEKTTAQLQQAKRDLERYTTLLSEGYVTQSQYDQMVTYNKTLEATVKADTANLQNAKIQLSYCYIYAPVDGKIGSILIDKGNVIKANDDKPLAIINQIQPVYVAFSIPELYLDEIRDKFKKEGVKVMASATNNNKTVYTGQLTFIDNAVDKTTGTIRMKARFDNKDLSMLPGQFMNVSINLSILKGSLSVPSEAVQIGQKGEYVYRLKDDMTVEIVSVKSIASSEGFTAIQGDVKDGDRVVIEGQQRLAPGMKVTIKNTPDKQGKD
ncbi:MAG: efflux RND transporter periplasmic adaptor subunit [Thermodesulfovibrionales bacterium]|nr:efflux RND transporter periplasmic adaptor subunit [Thermodesulfovibrionales bacterium]